MVHELQCSALGSSHHSTAWAGTHSNWFPDRSWFRGRFKLANRLTLRRFRRLAQFFMQSNIYGSVADPRGPLCTVVSWSNVSYLELPRFNSEREQSADEDWSLPIRTSYRSAIIYWQFRRRLMIISLVPSRFLLRHRVIYERIDNTGTFPAFDLRRANGALSSFTRLSSCIARSERPWTSLRMSSATPADFIDVRASKARAPHLGFDRTEIVLLCVLKKRFHCRFIVSHCGIARPTWHVYSSPSPISQELMIYCLIQNRPRLER